MGGDESMPRNPELGAVAAQGGKQRRRLGHDPHCDGRYGVVLANWTTESQSVAVSAPRLGKKAAVHVCGKKAETSTVVAAPDGFHIALPPLACALVADEERTK